MIECLTFEHIEIAIGIFIIIALGIIIEVSFTTKKNSK